MPFIDQYGNEQVSFGPPVNDPPGGTLVDLLGGRSRVLGAVVRRRRVEGQLLLAVACASITTGGVYTYSTPFPCDNVDELMVFLDISGAPTAAITGLQMVVQTNDCFGGANGWINLAAPAAVTVPNATYVGVLNLAQFTNFGALVRLGVTCTGVGTGGTLNGLVLAKG